MVKILIPAVIILSLWGVIFYVFFLPKKYTNPTETNQKIEDQTQIKTSGSTEVPKTLPRTSEDSQTASDSSLLTKLNELSQQIGKITSLEEKITGVEKTTEDLKNRVGNLENNSTTSQGSTTTTSTTTITSKYPQYIYALGYGGSTTSTDWTEISNLKITIDPSLYPGFSNMQLEALVRVKDGNGKIFARLYSEGTAVTESELSTGSYQNIWTAGPTFINSSKKTYTIQIKSLTGYEAFISDARVKVNF